MEIYALLKFLLLKFFLVCRHFPCGLNVQVVVYPSRLEDTITLGVLSPTYVVSEG